MNERMHAEEPGVVVYSTPFCGYCAAAKSLLQAKGVAYVDIDLYEAPARRAEMITRTGRRTVPQIFIGAEHIGGFDDLQALEAAGQLDAKLAALLPA
jgi:glutaredoxin 3